MSSRRALKDKDAVRKYLVDLDDRLPAVLADDSSPYDGFLGLIRLHRYREGDRDPTQHNLSRPSTIEDVEPGGQISAGFVAASARAE